MCMHVPFTLLIFFFKIPCNKYVRLELKHSVFPIHSLSRYRHSAADYADTVDGYYPPKYAPNNYGYITQTDYARYCLPPTQKYATNRHISSSATSMDNNYIRSGNSIRQDNGLPAGNRGSLIV